MTEDVFRRLDLLEAELERLRKADSGTVATAWVPTYLGGSTAGVTTYTIQEAYYWLFDPIVFIDIRITWTNATGTGNAQVSLPFTAATSTNGGFVLGVWSSGLTFANNNVVGRIINGQAFLTFQSLLTNAAATASAVEVAGDVIISGWYTI